MSSPKHRRHLLLLAGLALGGLAALPAHAATDEAPRAVIVARGSASVHARPDSVRIELGVEAQAATLEQARKEASTAMTHVIGALKALELPGLAIETRSLRMSPVYSTTRDNHPPSIIGYSVGNHVLVTASHAPEAELAERSARIVDTALNAGANNVGSVDFFLADSSHVEDEALTLAVQRAESDAQTMARAAGVTLAGPVWIEEASAARVPRAFAMEAATLSTPVEVGDIVIESSVTAKYAFR